MKKFLFPVIALLLFIGCSSSEDSITKIDSYIQLDNLKLQAYIFEGNYYIEAIDASGNNVFTIKDKAEGYIEYLEFGDKKEYPINGCYIEDALKKGDLLYILVSLYGHLEYHPHKFILKLRDGKVLQKVYFDKNDSESKSFFPERIADWYGEHIIIYTTAKTYGGNIAVLDKDLKQIFGCHSVNSEILVSFIEKGSYISPSINSVVYIASKNTVWCVEVSQNGCMELWTSVITEEEIRIDKETFSLEGDNVIVDVEAITKSGEKKKYHLVLNKNTGEIITPNQITQ